MNRRSIFKLFAGAVMASAMEVCGLMPTSMRRHSDLICILDARNCFHFNRQLQAVISGLKSHLPSEGKFFLKWVNVYDKQTNPHSSTGYFLAVPRDDDSEDHITVDTVGFIDDLRRMT